VAGGGGAEEGRKTRADHIGRRLLKGEHEKQIWGQGGPQTRTPMIWNLSNKNKGRREDIGYHCHVCWRSTAGGSQGKLGHADRTNGARRVQDGNAFRKKTKSTNFMLVGACQWTNVTFETEKRQWREKGVRRLGDSAGMFPKGQPEG